MKKKIIVSLFVLFLGTMFFFAGCGSTSGGNGMSRRTAGTVVTTEAAE